MDGAMPLVCTVTGAALLQHRDGFRRQLLNHGFRRTRSKLYRRQPGRAGECYLGLGHLG